MSLDKLYGIHLIYNKFIQQHLNDKYMSIYKLLTDEAKSRIGIPILNTIEYIKSNPVKARRLTEIISWDYIRTNTDIKWDYDYIFKNAPLDIVLLYSRLDINKERMKYEISHNKHITLEFITSHKDLINIEIYSNPKLIHEIKKPGAVKYDFNTKKLIGLVNEYMTIDDFVCVYSTNPLVDEHIFSFMINSSTCIIPKVVLNILSHDNGLHMAKYFERIILDSLRLIFCNDIYPIIDHYVFELMPYYQKIIEKERNLTCILKFSTINKYYDYTSIYNDCKQNNIPFSTIYNHSLGMCQVLNNNNISIMEYVENFDMLIEMVSIEKKRRIETVNNDSDHVNSDNSDNDIDIDDIDEEFMLSTELLPCEFITEMTPKLKELGLEWDYTTAITNPSITIQFIQEHPDLQDMLRITKSSNKTSICADVVNNLFCYDPIFVSSDYKKYLVHRFMKICGSDLKSHVSTII